jgi:hypothetical protein
MVYGWHRGVIKSLFENLRIYEFCFPAAVTEETEVECPYCHELLTIAVADPMGEEVYQCCDTLLKFSH